MLQLDAMLRSRPYAFLRTGALLEPPISSTLSRWFFALLALYLGIHGLIRALLWQSLEYDEAEQLVFVQSLAWGYSGQPPLYTWLLWPLAQLLGAGVLALAVLKFSLLGVMYALLYRVASRLIADRRLAMLAALSPLLVPYFAWEAIRMGTHTPLLGVFTLATLLSLLRIRDEGRGRDFVALGAWVGLGMLSKYNFAIFAAALLLAALCDPDLRAKLATRRLLLSVLVAGLLVAPHAWWLIEHLQEAAHSVMRYAANRSETRLSAAGGYISLAKNLALGLAPVAIVGLALFPKALQTRDPSTADTRLLARFFAIAALMLLGVVACGVREFRVHWFAPLILLVPVWFFSRIQGQRVARWRQAGFGTAIGVAVIGVLAVRTAAFCFDWEAGKYQSRDFLYAAQAEGARDEGFRHGVILVADPIIAGYQRLHFPEAAVHCLDYPSCFAQPGAARECLVVWDATSQRDLPRRLQEQLATSRISPAAVALEPRFVEGPRCMFNSATRRLGYVLLPSAEANRLQAMRF